MCERGELILVLVEMRDKGVGHHHDCSIVMDGCMREVR